MGLLLMGFRSMARNPRRSVLTVTALAIGAAIMITGVGWIRGYYSTVYNGIKRLETGDLEVLRAGYQEQVRRLPLDLAIADAASAARKVQDAPGVQAVAPRIDFSATVATGAGSVRVLGRAIDPGAEAQVTIIRQFIERGSYLGHGGGVLLGAVLARKLGAKIGDPVALTAVDRYSVENFVEIPVTGILHFGLPSMDEGLVMVDLQTARDLLGMSGEATRLVVRLKPGISESSARAAVAGVLAGGGDVVRSWRDFAQVIVSATSADIGGFWIVFFVVFLLIVIGIINSMSMTVQERTREIGTLRAIGMRRSQVTLLFVIEAGSLALIAAAAGCVLGGAVAWYVGTVGFDFSEISLEMPIPLGHRFTGDFRLVDFFAASAVSVISALAGSVLPIRRAVRMNIPRSLGTRIE